MSSFRRRFLRLIAPLAARVAPVRWKEWNELSYWRRKRLEEGELSNEHYAYFYTKHFGLDSDFFVGKTILDIGCGPRGSLEWATGAARRIGLDPLAERYLSLGADRHAMEYISAGSESIPLPDASCDVLTAFNALDHVENVGRSLAEIKRVTRPGGRFLLLVEINHPPRPEEPHSLSTSIVEDLEPEFSCVERRVYRPVVRGMFQAILENVRLSDAEADRENGYLSAHFVRT